MNEIKFLYNAPAILIKDTIIVGDTHFGMENKLRRKGIYDDGFSMRLLEKIKDLIKTHKAKKIIFLGDVKEDITYIDEKTRKILIEIKKISEIKIIKGNHDGGIEEFLGIEIFDGLLFENLGLVHGHAWPKEEIFQAQYLVVGHQHPLLEKLDNFGKKHTEPVWIFADPNPNEIQKHYTKFNEKIKLILMPAFNPLVGFPINSRGKNRFGPILNNNLFKLEDALVFGLDGTCLGLLNEKS